MHQSCNAETQEVWWTQINSLKKTTWFIVKQKYFDGKLYGNVCLTKKIQSLQCSQRMHFFNTFKKPVVSFTNAEGKTGDPGNQEGYCNRST